MLNKNNYLRQVTGMLALLLLLASGFVGAQKLSRAAPFPEASEELYGIGSGGKLYVFGGLAPGFKPKGLVYEYDPAKDAWTNEKGQVYTFHFERTSEKGQVYTFHFK